MKNIEQLLSNVAVVKTTGDMLLPVSQLCFDSRQAAEGSMFFAVRGSVSDGHQFIQQVVEKGCRVVVCEDLPEVLNPNVTYIQVKDSACALGVVADNFYEHPSSQLKLVGVTGTNGKTSVATLLYQLFEGMGEKCGLLSTVENRIGKVVVPATHTTPDPVSLNSFLSKMVEAGCSYCFMEVSSHAVVQQRISGLNFAGAIFTNITHDHLDYHKTFENYIKAKKGFFDQLSESAFALVNADDRNGSVMVQNCKAKKYMFSMRTVSDFNAKVIENQLSGLQLNINGVDVYTRLIGTFNAYNILAVYAASLLLGAEQVESLRVISGICPPEGRFDQLRSSKLGITGIVDYAHTPDALKNVLQTIADLRTGNEQLITLVGCGGNRDAAKRPLMAQIAAQYSDLTILTSDNPRNENPETIIDEMFQGLSADVKKDVIKITDRREAIRTACRMAKKGDIILVAGKGHEKYQEIQGVKHPFDDKEILNQLLLEQEK